MTSSLFHALIGHLYVYLLLKSVYSIFPYVIILFVFLLLSYNFIYIHTVCMCVYIHVCGGGIYILDAC